jgi:DNA-binding XRE family transcriptional regulator
MAYSMNDFQLYLDQALSKIEISDADQRSAPFDYDIEKEVCRLISSTRNLLGITQSQLAEKSGVSQANISKIENGTYNPSIATLKRIADGLGKRLIIEFDAWEEK